MLWYDDVRCGAGDPCHRRVTHPESTIEVWIVDAAGTRVWLEAETYRVATPEVEVEIEAAHRIDRVE